MGSGGREVDHGLSPNRHPRLGDVEVVHMEPQHKLISLFPKKILWNLDIVACRLVENHEPCLPLVFSPWLVITPVHAKSPLPHIWRLSCSWICKFAPLLGFCDIQVFYILFGYTNAIKLSHLSPIFAQTSSHCGKC